MPLLKMARLKTKCTKPIHSHEHEERIKVEEASRNKASRIPVFDQTTLPLLFLCFSLLVIIEFIMRLVKGEFQFVLTSARLLSVINVP